jgi:LacI family transcriptional regulator
MGIGPERQERFAKLGIPLVSIDYPLDGVPSVTVDNVAGGELAAEQLKAAGSRRLAMITGPSAALAFRQREEGFARAAGMGAPIVRADGVSRDAGRAAAAALLDGHPDLDGIATVNDLLALGVVEELRLRGRRIPDDVQVTGFDDQPLMDVLGLSTVRQPMLAFGEWAARAIQSLIHAPRTPVASTRLSLSFIPRATTRHQSQPAAASATAATINRPSSRTSARPRAARKERP